LRRVPRDWHIRIIELTGTPLPRLLVHPAQSPVEGDDVGGTVWRLTARDRDLDLDSNGIALPPDRRIEARDGPSSTCSSR
jgi:hypothetical protein